MKLTIVRRNPIQYLDLSPTLIDRFEKGLPFPADRRAHRARTIGPAASRAATGGTLSTAPEVPARSADAGIGSADAAATTARASWRRLFSKLRGRPARDTHTCKSRNGG